MRRKRCQSWPPDCSPCYFTPDYTEACAHQAAIMTLKEQNKLQSQHQMWRQWACGCQTLPAVLWILNFFSVFFFFFRFGKTAKGHRTNWFAKMSSQLFWWRSEWKPKVGCRDDLKVFHLLLTSKCRSCLEGLKSQCSAAVNVQWVRMRPINETYWCT